MMFLMQTQLKELNQLKELVEHRLQQFEAQKQAWKLEQSKLKELKRQVQQFHAQVQFATQNLQQVEAQNLQQVEEIKHQVQQFHAQVQAQAKRKRESPLSQLSQWLASGLDEETKLTTPI